MTTPAPETTPAATADDQGQQATADDQQQSTTTQQPEGQQQESGGQDLEYWKKRSRDNEAKAKANAKAAQELQQLKDAGKTDEQRVAEETARAQQERDEARAETLRYKAAAKYRVGEDHFDLLGTGTEDEIDARAKVVGQLLADQAELKAIKEKQAAEQAEQQPQGDGTGPVKKLAPGTPPQADSSYPTDWFPGVGKKRKHDPTKS